MKFLVTSKGFLKQVKKNRTKDENGNTTGVTTEIIFTQKIREAHIFATKGKAMKCADMNSIEGFAWSPLEQTPIKDKYEVVRRERYNDFMNESDHHVLEWYVRKVFMDSDSDIRFLQSGNPVNPNHLDREAADRLCLEKNILALNELKNKIKSSLMISRSEKILETVDDTSNDDNSDPKPCDHNYPSEKGWMASQPDVCSNCGEDL